MRWPEVAAFLIASASLSGCAGSFSSQQRPSKWTTGFWFWQGSSTEANWSSEPLDVLFVHVGTIGKDQLPFAPRTDRWYVSGSLPAELPPAREYWLVFRFERQGVPDLQVAPSVAQEVSQLRAAAQKRHLNLVGVQLDIDSPTGALSQYANFLREVRKGLPPAFEISITALLDWFRSGTAIAEVIREVDEFVPQFYDLADRHRLDGGTAIATRIDATRWGPVFNRLGKRFRVGISTFGRARMVPRDASSPSGYVRLAAFFGDLAPVQIAPNPAFHMQATRNQANELVLSYRATRKTRIGYNNFDPGDIVQFILSTPEAVRAAIESVRQIKGLLAGVVFFRWPSSDEGLAMQPDEVLIAAGLTARNAGMRSGIHVVNGRCAAVECVDIYLKSANPFSSKLVRYRIRSSTELEYFLPEQDIPVRMTSPSQLEVSLPPYCGRGRLYLGRAVTATHAEFTVEEEQ